MSTLGFHLLSVAGLKSRALQAQAQEHAWSNKPQLVTWVCIWYSSNGSVPRCSSKMIALLPLEWLESSYVTASVHYWSHHHKQMPIKCYMEALCQKFMKEQPAYVQRVVKAFEVESSVIYTGMGGGCFMPLPLRSSSLQCNNRTETMLFPNSYCVQIFPLSSLLKNNGCKSERF